MRYVNLTPHPVGIIRKGKVQVIQPSGKVVRVKVLRRRDGEIDGVALYRQRLDGVWDDSPLAELAGGEPTMAIVSMVTGMFIAAEGKVYPNVMVVSPDTKHAPLFDKTRRVKAVSGFVVYTDGLRRQRELIKEEVEG